MRRILLAIALAGGAIAGLVGTTAAPSGAALGLVDFGTTTESDPGVVAPPGALVRYVVTYSNSGGTAWTGSGSNATTGGGSFVAVDGDITGCTLPSAGAVDPIITCDLSLAPGQTKALGVVVQTPANGDDLTNTSAVAADLNVFGVIPDDNTTNDTATASTVVTMPTTGSSAYLRPGESLQYRNHVMTAREAYGTAGGVLASMQDSVIGPNATCGQFACSTQGLNYDFTDGDPGEAYAGLVDIQVAFEAKDPCYGNGNPKCWQLYYRLPAPGSDVIDPNAPAHPVPSCANRSSDPKVPCLTGIERTIRGFVYNVEARTNDPDLIPLPPLTGTAK